MVSNMNTATSSNNTVYGVVSDMGGLDLQFEPTTDVTLDGLKAGFVRMFGDMMMLLPNPSVWKLTFEGNTVNEDNVSDVFQRVTENNPVVLSVSPTFALIVGHQQPRGIKKSRGLKRKRLARQQ